MHKQPVLRKIILLFTFLIFATNSNASFIYASGALKAGYGTTSTTDGTTVPSTKMTSYAVDGSLGFRFYGILLGASGEYSFVRQLTKPSEVSNVNTQGSLKAVYPMVGFDFGVIRIVGKLPSVIAGEYKLDKPNSSGQEVIYKDADAFSLQVHWKPSSGGLVLPYVYVDQSRGSSTFWGLEYQTLTFKKTNTNGVESTLTDAQQFKIKSYSILYGFFF